MPNAEMMHTAAKTMNLINFAIIFSLAHFYLKIFVFQKKVKRLINKVTSSELLVTRATASQFQELLVTNF